MEEWKVGRLEEWKVGRLEEWKNGRSEEWKVEGWKVEKLDVALVGLPGFAEFERIKKTYQILTGRFFGVGKGCHRRSAELSFLTIKTGKTCPQGAFGSKIGRFGKSGW